MQSRKSSFIEAVMNVAIGFIISFIAQLIIYPAYGARFTLLDNLQIGILFTLLSLLRSYVIRRWFNGYIKKAAEAVVS
jgi:membrane protein implicated in regulation of membrane protease activity